MDYLQYSYMRNAKQSYVTVLNLIINGLPSIPNSDALYPSAYIWCFKPYYKWITFNTERNKVTIELDNEVLNLIINGLPSILYKLQSRWLP